MSVKNILDAYEAVEIKEPVLVGHILKKFLDNFGSAEKIQNWATDHNLEYNFPPVSTEQMNECQTLFRNRHAKNLVENCKKVAHFFTCEIKVPKVGKDKLKNKIKIKNAHIKELRKKVKEEVKKLQQKKVERKNKQSHEDQLLARKLYYDCLLNGVPSHLVFTLMRSILEALNIEKSDVSSTTTINCLVGDLGFLTDLNTVETILKARNSTLLFDVTTQDSIHVNCVILTTKESSHVISLEQLVGRTALDCKDHICDSIKDLADVYSSATDMTFDDCLQRLIGTINNCLTARTYVNYDTVDLLEVEWQKKLTKFNCNLNPLEAISCCVKNVLADHESPIINDTYHLNECLANEVIVAMNSLIYDDKKGFVNKFTSFLQDEGFMTSFVPRFYGNWIHIIFHISTIYFCHYKKFQKFVLGLPNLIKSDFKLNLQEAFQEEILLVEFHVLGIIDKLLSGPWISTFYMAPDKQSSTTVTRSIIKGVIQRLEVQIQDPVSILNATTDFFGNSLPENDEMKELMKPSENIKLFTTRMKACLEGIVSVLRRQYEHSFNEVAKATEAKKHTMLAKSAISEYCDHKKSAPNSYVGTLGTRIKAKRNNVREFINSQDDPRLEYLIKLARPYSRKLLNKSRFKKVKRLEEITKRIKKKRVKKEETKRESLQTSLENLVDLSFDSIHKEFPDMSYDILVNIKDILEGNIVGQCIKHLWTLESETCHFIGKILDFCDDQYEICYLKENEEIGEDYELTKYEVGADFLCKDLYFITI